MSTLGSRFLAILLTWAILTSGVRAPTAAPWIMLFERAEPPLRVVLADWQKNQQVMLAIGGDPGPSEAALANRPRIRVVLFWGGEWANWKTRGVDLDRLTLADGTQHASFYPATRTTRAAWAYETRAWSPSHLRVVDENGLAVLRSHGIPVGPGRTR